MWLKLQRKNVTLRYLRKYEPSATTMLFTAEELINYTKNLNKTQNKTLEQCEAIRTKCSDWKSCLNPF
ncbi:hypothetical protein QTP88_006781 [Uroleucon formosanum]